MARGLIFFFGEERRKTEKRERAFWLLPLKRLATAPRKKKNRVEGRRERGPKVEKREMFSFLLIPW